MAVSKTKENGMTDRLLSALTIMTSMFSLAGEKDSVSHYLAMAEEVAAELPENSVAVLGPWTLRRKQCNLPQTAFSVRQ